MLERFLFIGTGGTGGTVLHHTWAQLDKWLRARGYTEGMPDGWQFLHFDLPENPDIVKGDVPALAGSAVEYVNLAVSPLTYANYDKQLLQMVGSPEAMAGWRTDPTGSYPLPFDGAGQLRSVGNVISLAAQQRIRAAIDSARSRLGSTTTTAQLASISHRLQLPIPPVTPEPTVVLVTSLGGGSGSGMFLNVIEMLLAEANVAAWLGQRLYTVLFTPEALENEGAAAIGEGMEANSLGALSEFLNAFHHRGAVDPLDAHLFRAGGGGVVEGPRVGRYNFFVGKTNGKLGFASPAAVSKAIGKALAVLAADDSVRSTFQDYVGVNWRGQPVMAEYGIVEPGDINHAATALGYANVSLGREIFASYAAERLARHAVERLLRGHREYAGTTTRRDERLIEERANNAEEGFFSATGLYERTDAHNDVLERLCDKTALKTRIKSAINHVHVVFSEDGRAFNSDEALDAIDRQFRDRADEVVAWATTDRYERMLVWVSEMQRQLLGATAASIGSNGFAVTLELLNRLEQQARDAANELEADASQADKRLNSATTRLKSILARVRDRIDPQNAAFKATINDREGDLMDLVERDLFRFAAVHLRDVAEGLLPPLRRAVASAQAAIAQAVQGGDRKVLDEWSGRSVGSHLYPAQNELLLEPISDYPQQLDRLLMDEYELAALDAESVAVMEIISGAWLSTDDDDDGVVDQTLLVADAQWSPKTIGARPAQVSLGLDLRELRASAERWVRTRKGGISTFVQENIGEWLSTSDRATADRRSTAFLSELRSAIDLAAPLIRIGENAYTAIHGGGPPKPTLAVSRIPIAQGGKTPSGQPDPEAMRYQEVERLLTAAGVSRNDVPDLCDQNASVGAVEVMTFLGSSVHPTVFTSVTQPIVDRWERCTSEDHRRLFWQFRRSRQLSSFTPLSRQRQRQMARGWLVANELGYIRRLTGPWSEGPLDLWAPDGRLPFPGALMWPQPYAHPDVLPALMETLPLALMRLGRGAGAELSAYVRVLDLGDINGSKAAGREFEHWIQTGEYPDPVDGAAPHRHHIDADGVAGRAQFVSERLTNALTNYETSVMEVKVTATASLSVSRRWEARDVIVGALHDMIDKIETINTPTVSYDETGTHSV